MGLYHTTFTASDGTASKLALYYACRQLTPGQAMVRVSQFVATAQYEQQAPLRDTFLAGSGQPSATSNPAHDSSDDGRFRSFGSLRDGVATGGHRATRVWPAILRGMERRRSRALAVVGSDRAKLSDRSAFAMLNFEAGWNGVMGLPPDSGVGELRQRRSAVRAPAFDTPDNAASAYTLLLADPADPRAHPESTQLKLGEARTPIRSWSRIQAAWAPRCRSRRSSCEPAGSSSTSAGSPMRRPPRPPTGRRRRSPEKDWIASTRCFNDGGNELSLGSTALRLDEPADTGNPDTDAYVRVDGEDQPLYNTSAADLTTYNQRFGRATDV